MADEKSFTVSLKKVFGKPRTKRAEKAVRHVKRFLASRFRAKEESVKISQKINELLWKNGIENIPRKVSLKALKEDGVVRAFLPDEKIVKKEEKEKPEKEEKKETKEEAEKRMEIEEKKKEKKEKEKAAEKLAIKRQ